LIKGGFINNNDVTGITGHKTVHITLEWLS
jgi:hypothetical protein